MLGHQRGIAGEFNQRLFFSRLKTARINVLCRMVKDLFPSREIIGAGQKFFVGLVKIILQLKRSARKIKQIYKKFYAMPAISA